MLELECRACADHGGVAAVPTGSDKFPWEEVELGSTVRTFDLGNNLSHGLFSARSRIELKKGRINFSMIGNESWRD